MKFQQEKPELQNFTPKKSMTLLIESITRFLVTAVSVKTLQLF